MILLVLLMTGGCFKNDLEFQVRFEQNPGLAAKDSVIFQGNAIGVVEKVTYTKKGDYLIDVSVNSEFKNAATVDSKFYIAKDSKNPQKSNLVIEQTKPGGAVLDKGIVIQGSEQRSFLDKFISDFTTDLKTAIQHIKQEIDKNSDQVHTGIANTIKSISNYFEKFKSDISKIPEREDVKNLGRKLEQLHKEMVETEVSVRTKIQTEIIPQIEKELESLKNQLAPSGREEEVAPLEQELKEIKQV